MSISRVVLLLVTLSVSPLVAQSPAAPVQDGGVVRETELDRQVKRVAAQLRCVVCQGLSIQDSPSSLAQEMRAVVREQLAAGRTEQEVKDYFAARYGEWVLLQPKASGFNLVVYLLPIAAILGGAAFVYVRARRWTRSPQDAGDEVVSHAGDA
ncbi:MAG TPA: cytochrome c-type biogenesis protein [Longimicrobiales bacterium]